MDIDKIVRLTEEASNAGERIKTGPSNYSIEPTEKYIMALLMLGALGEKVDKELDKAKMLPTFRTSRSHFL